MGCNQSKEKNDKIDENATEQPERDDQKKYDVPSDEDIDEEQASEKAGSVEREDGLKFNLDGPSKEGAAESFFKTILYKLSDESGWYLYNDDDRYEVHLNFKTKSDLTPGEDTEKSEADGGYNQYKLCVYPGETKKLFEGEPNGYKYGISAKPLSDEYCARIAKEAAGVVREEQEKVQSYWDELKDADNYKGKADDDDSSDDDADELKLREATLRRCIAENAPYVDLQFPPNQESLSKNSRSQMPACAWKRPSMYLKGDDKGKQILIDDVEPNDIDQGRLGDCWFLCAVASLAENPDKIRDIFRHPTRKLVNIKAEREVGAYRVTINKHGWWYVELVDDYLPCVGDKPCFAKNVEDPKEMWVSLLEKAFAKLHGSYGAIVGGDALQALQDLTGYPSKRFDNWEKDDKDTIFDEILKFDQEGYLINVNTPGSDESSYMGHHGAKNSKEFSESYKKAGLGMGHAYSILVAKHFPDKNLKLVQIRNPWGNGTEWSGDWGDESPLWEENPDVKEACNFTPGADGTFWMKWEDCKRYFDGGGACFMKKDWYDYRVRGTFTSAVPDVMLELTVEEDTEMFLVLSQKDRRGLAQSDPESKYAAMMLSVCQFDDSRNKYSAVSNTSAELDKPGTGYYYCTRRDNAMLITLKKSDKPYLIVPRAHKSAPKTKEFCLGVISASPVGPGHNVKAKFMQPSKDWGIFDNYVRFDYEDGSSAQAVDRTFQFNPEVGCPKTKRGGQLRGGKKQ